MSDQVATETEKIPKVALDVTEIMMRKSDEETEEGTEKMIDRVENEVETEMLKTGKEVKTEMRKTEKEVKIEMVKTGIEKGMKGIVVEVIGGNGIANIGKMITGMMKNVMIAKEKTMRAPDEKRMTQKE